MTTTNALAILKGAIPIGTQSDLTAALAQASLSRETQRAYRKGLRNWERWCADGGLEPYPIKSADVEAWVAHLVSHHYALSTIHQNIWALRTIVRMTTEQPELVGEAMATRKSKTRHMFAPVVVEFETPQLRAVLDGAARVVSAFKEPEQAQAFTVEQVKAMALAISDVKQPTENERFDTPTSVAWVRSRRDLLLLSWGVVGGLRISELASCLHQAVTVSPDGAGVTVTVIGKSGRRDVNMCAQQAFPLLCPVLCYRAWCDVMHEFAVFAPMGQKRPWYMVGAKENIDWVFRAITSTGRISRSAMNSRSIGRLVAPWAAAANIPAGDFSGHSLRATFATLAAKKGADVAHIAKHMGHRDPKTTLTYVRDVEPFGSENASSGLLG